MTKVYLAFYGKADLNAHEGYDGTDYISATGTFEGAIEQINQFRRKTMQKRKDFTLADGANVPAYVNECDRESKYYWDSGTIIWYVENKPDPYSEEMFYILVDEVKP